MSVAPRTAWRAALGLALLVSGGVAVAAVAGAEDPADPTEVVPVTPYRILDTRSGLGAAGPVGGGQTIDVQMAGVGPVPANAVGVVLNVTGTGATAPTWVAAWPSGSERPNASVLNLQPGVDAPNAVTALLGPNGKLSLYNDTGSTHLIADVAGYLLPAGSGGQPGPAGPQGPVGPQGPAAASGHQIVTAAGTVLAGNATGVASATCPAGKEAIGGGGQANYDTDDESIVIRSSFQTAPDSWQVAYTRLAGPGVGQAVAFTAYAICVNA
jgi:hypothetical protein